MAECLAGTAYGRARWLALCRGGVAACRARKPNVAYCKWWHHWQSTAVTVHYATRWKDPAVIAPTNLPVWTKPEGPGSTPARVGLMSI